jgi:lysophospholipase L1-like esterase
MSFSKKIVYAFYLFAVTFLLFELALRIYNPFHFRIKGDHIFLQTNKTFVVYNNDIPLLDKKIIHTKNNIGFRGPQKPDSLNKYLSIISVGGSTTECPYLADGKTWNDDLYRRLQKDFEPVWLNNAGLAGHSTFGHIAMLQDYVSKLHPKAALFLIGANEIERDDLNASDKSNMQGYYGSFFTFFSKNSEVCNVIANLIRTRRAAVRKLNDRYIDIKAGMYDTLALPETFIAEKLNRQKPYLSMYQKRLEIIAGLCRQNNIAAIFITQPTLFGSVTDSITGAHLGVFKLAPDQNGESWWRQLEVYNDVTRKVARQQKLHIIDLAALMPKSSEYFYDQVHFTNAGSQKVAAILYNNLNRYLAEQFPQYLKH